MAYQVLARKYRPQRFSDVVGQDHVTQTLTHAIQQNRIAHAYLFVGPRGTGKTTLARILAKSLNCTDGPKVTFDEADPRCREIVEGRSLDVIEIDGASNRGIEEIRALRETVRYVPASSKFKIYIIDEVHMLTKEAFNALLKTLEEPPAHVKFLFATTEPEKVLPTILSRCQRFDLRRIPASLIVKQLAHIASLEKVTIQPEALRAIARGAEGGMRDAQSALDQLISFCGSEIVEADVLAMFGLTAQGQIVSLAQNILNGQPEMVLRQLNDLAKNGKDLGRLLADLLGYFRNLLIFKISKGDTTLLEAAEAEIATLAQQAREIQPPALTRIMEVLTDCESRLRDAPSKKILIEVALLKAIEMRHALSIDNVLEKLSQLQRGTGENSSCPAPSPLAPGRPEKSAPAGPEMKSPPPLSTAAKSGHSGEATPGRARNLLELWQEIVSAVANASPFVRSYLLEAHPVSYERKVLTIGFDPEFADHLSLVDTAKTRTVIATKLQEITGEEAQIRFVSAERPAGDKPLSPAPASVSGPAAPAPQAGGAAPPVVAPKSTTLPFNRQELSGDPLIQKALEIFKGQIVEVRA